MPLVGLQCLIAVFSDHTHLLSVLHNFFKEGPIMHIPYYNCLAMNLLICFIRTPVCRDVVHFNS